MFVEHVQLRQKARRGQTFGRGVEQRDIATAQALLHRVGFFAAQAGVQKISLNARFVQRTHLVVHQGDEGRHHNRQALPQTLTRNGRDLIAQRFAPAGGHEHQRVTTAHHMFNDGLLMTSESRITKHLAQDVQGIHI